MPRSTVMANASPAISPVLAILPPVHTAIASRRARCCTMNVIPSRIAARMPTRCPVRSAWNGRRISIRLAAEKANEAASIASVCVAPMSPTRIPAIAGPRTKDRLTIPSTADTARPRTRRSTRFGTAPDQPDMNSTRKTLIGNVTRRITPIVGMLNRTERGISAGSAARPASAMSIIRRRSTRSAIAPDGSPNRRSGSVLSAPTIPIATPEPVNWRTSSGSAVMLTASPTAETPWPSRITRKSRLHLRGMGGGGGVGPAVARPAATSGSEGGPAASPGAALSVVRPRAPRSRPARGPRAGEGRRPV